MSVAPTAEAVNPKPVAGMAAVFDLLAPSTFRDGHPHEAYDRLRRTSPVVRGEKGGPWLVTGYEEIREVSANSKDFTSAAGFRVHSANRAAMDPAIGRVLSRFMLAMDEPEHGDFRKLVGSFFKPAAIKALEPAVAQRVDRVMKSLEGREEVEFVEEVGARVPISTICALIGVPPEDEHRVFEFTNAVFGTDDPELAPSIEMANAKYLEIFDYGWNLLEKRRRDPQDDLVSFIANAELPDGRKLTRDEQISYFSNMIAAGNETTRSSLSGAVWLLARHPEQRNRLMADPSMIPQAIQEILRHFSPVIHMARTATRNCRIGDVEIGAGDRVAMLYGAGNHDPAVFEDPHRFDCERKDAIRHLSFGYGIHHCLGNRLAVLQLGLILGRFLRTFPRYEVAGDISFIQSNFVLAMKRLPIRLGERSGA
ncbi:cytochrome P450 [Qipengyuania zhejiangensis]|uniref:cytochrome P450 n=1 Tax=Qipengyuania zhejiangensis TaxID=3077782 RepID=UPI002D76B26F|nr:cytochrome P450 [Qipengyuania sp. Z2]